MTSINLDELRLRVETHDRVQFVTTNGKYATYCIARDENHIWHVWLMREHMWLPLPADTHLHSLDAALNLIPNKVEYRKLYFHGTLLDPIDAT